MRYPKLLSLLLLLGLECLGFASGNPVQKSIGNCNEYVVDVIGHHYTPHKDCDPLGQVRTSRSAEKMEESSNLPSSRIQKRSMEIGNVINLLNSNLNLNERTEPGVLCTACKSAVLMLKYMISDGRPESEIVELGTGLCIELEIMTEPICKGILKLNGPALIHIVNQTSLEPLGICSYLMGADCGQVDLPGQDWNVSLPEMTKPPLPVNAHQTRMESPKLKVLHISDTHFDPDYQEDTLAECKLPICCRNGSGSPTENATKAGKWGGWKCDIPERTLDNLLEHISKQHQDIDYIIWTGDIPPHDSWNQTQNMSINLFKATVSKMFHYFPNTPIYPAIGNHESSPPNLFPIPSASNQWSIEWLYDEVDKQWRRWLPDYAADTMRRGAFYTTLARPGLRIVSLNTNYCYYNNWWLILNSKDPADELEWLVGVLQNAEEKHEKVHIIGHIPPGTTDCLRVWQKNYYNIIQRYNSTVTGQFFGHTHNDEYELFYDELGHPINVAYVGPSATTYTYLNPGYRIYYVQGDYEGSQRTVVDHETWIMDLENANKRDEPIWSKLYSAREAYNMTSLTPHDWHQLYLKMHDDPQLFDLYDKYFWKNSPKRPECNDICKEQRFCGIRSCVQYDKLRI